MLHPDPATPGELARLEALIDRWLTTQLAENPAVAGCERVVGDEPGAVARWYLRLAGDEKPTFGVLFELGQRTLRYDTQLMPSPVEAAGELYEHLLRRNWGLYGCHLAIGPEAALYLVGQLDVRHLDEPELDRVLGTLYLATEQFFRPAMRLGYGSTFR